MNNYDEIRKRFSKITQGKWYAKDTFGTPEVISKERKIAKVLYHGGSEDNEVWANAQFISHAPEDIAFLIGEVERLTAELYEEKRNRKELYDIAVKESKARDETEYALQKMTEARDYCKELLDKQIARNEGLDTQRNKWKRRAKAIEQALRQYHKYENDYCQGVLCATCINERYRDPMGDKVLVECRKCVNYERWCFDEDRFLDNKTEQSKNKNISPYDLALDLFGEMRNMNDEEKAWRQEVLDSVSTDIGISVYDVMDGKEIKETTQKKEDKAMERLTYWNDDYKCWSYHCASGDVAIKLAKYEDIEDKVKKLCTNIENHIYYLENGEIIECMLLGIAMNENAELQIDILDSEGVPEPVLNYEGYYVDVDFIPRHILIPLDEFGKTVFLSIEKAERAKEDYEDGKSM